jgi:uncharacterized Zn finger protein
MGKGGGKMTTNKAYTIQCPQCGDQYEVSKLEEKNVNCSACGRSYHQKTMALVKNQYITDVLKK